MKNARQVTCILGSRKIENLVLGVLTGSRSGVTASLASGLSCSLFVAVGILGGRQQRHEMARRGIMMNPTMRIVHSNRMVGFFKSSLMTIGQITPPREEPAMTIPIAAPRLTLIYWPTRASMGQTKSARDAPSKIPCARMNW